MRGSVHLDLAAGAHDNAIAIGRQRLCGLGGRIRDAAAVSVWLCPRFAWSTPVGGCADAQSVGPSCLASRRPTHPYSVGSWLKSQATQARGLRCNVSTVAYLPQPPCPTSTRQPVELQGRGKSRVALALQEQRASPNRDSTYACTVLAHRPARLEALDRAMMSRQPSWAIQPWGLMHHLTMVVSPT